MTEEQPWIGATYRRLSDHSLERLEALDAVERFVRTRGGTGFMRSDGSPAADYTDLTMLAEWLLHSPDHEPADRVQG